MVMNSFYLYIITYIKKDLKSRIYKRGNKMIKSKKNIRELLEEIRSFTYFKNNTEIDVILKERQSINIRYYDDKCIVINFLDYKMEISMLYKDRKYINMRIV